MKFYVIDLLEVNSCSKETLCLDTSFDDDRARCKKVTFKEPILEKSQKEPPFISQVRNEEMIIFLSVGK